MSFAKLMKITSIVVAMMIPTMALTLEPAPGKERSDKAKNEKKEDRKDRKDTQEAAVVLSAGVSFSYKDVRRYAVESNLTGQKPLPPGIRKNLARGKPMPPGIAKTRLPSSFLTRLPAHDGYEWHAAGVDLVLVVKADKSISDVVKDVFE